MFQQLSMKIFNEKFQLKVVFCSPFVETCCIMKKLNDYKNGVNGYSSSKIQNK